MKEESIIFPKGILKKEQIPHVFPPQLCQANCYSAGHANLICWMWKPEVIKYMRENIAMYCFLQGIVCRERIEEDFSSRTQNDYEKESILVI